MLLCHRDTLRIIRRCLQDHRGITGHRGIIMDTTGTIITDLIIMEGMVTARIFRRHIRIFRRHIRIIHHIRRGHRIRTMHIMPFKKNPPELPEGFLFFCFSILFCVDRLFLYYRF
jgi:hypothetical protein